MNFINVDGTRINTNMIESIKVVPVNVIRRQSGKSHDENLNLVDNAVVEGDFSCEVTMPSGAIYRIGKKRFSLTASCSEHEYKEAGIINPGGKAHYLLDKLNATLNTSKEAEALLNEVIAKYGI